MKAFWNKGAAENPYHWVMTGKKHWEKQEYYMEGQKHVEEMVLPFVRDHVPRLEDCASKTFLDIGCGTGRMTIFLKPFFREVIGTDVSEEMIKQATLDHQGTGVRFHATSGVDLHALESESVDIGFSFAAYQHIPRKSAVVSNMREVYRVLKPNGFAKIEVRGAPGNPPGKVVWFRGFERCYLAFVLWRGVIPILFMRFYTPLYGACFGEKELYNILRSIGFQSIKVYKKNMRHLWAEITKSSQYKALMFLFYDLCEFSFVFSEIPAV